MNELSTYYGLAVLRNKDSIEDMRKEIWAGFYHKISTDKQPQHLHCPLGADSWCKYQKLKATNNLKGYKHPPALDEEAQEILKPIYNDLTKDDTDLSQKDRASRRDTRMEENQFHEESEGLLYGAGIAD
ncbi:hypothetical protein TKK_0018606 [Trichogramma kaykai]